MPMREVHAPPPFAPPTLHAANKAHRKGGAREGTGGGGAPTGGGGQKGGQGRRVLRYHGMLALT